MPLDGLPAKCESESVPGVLFSMQALERAEYAALESCFYAGTVVFDTEFKPVCRSPAFQLDAAAGSGVARGVLEQVAQDAAEQMRIEPGRLVSTLDVDAYPVGGENLP